MIYLDNAATTRPIFHRSSVPFFNVNRSYATFEKLNLERAQATIKSYLKVKSGLILYFRGATEAIEWLANKFYRVEVHPASHESVWNIRKDDNKVVPILYCDQLINPVTGYVCARINKDTKSNYDFVGCDFTAAIGHIVMPEDTEEIYDAVWFSGHKFYTDKNMGAMWISDRLAKYLKANSDIRNQYGLVHGTLDVSGCVMLAKAMNWIQDNEISILNHCDDLYSCLLHSLRESDIGSILYHRPKSNVRSTAIIPVHLKCINADALISYLASNGIYVGAGKSACSESEDYRVLDYFGCQKEDAKSVVRISFSFENTELEIHTLIDNIKTFKEKYV